MAYILHVWIIDPGDNTIKVKHEFYGLTEKECETYYREHTSSCEYFNAAVKEDRVLEDLEEVDRDDLPTSEGVKEELESPEEEDWPAGT